MGKSRPWTIREEQTLRELYGKVRPAEIGRRIDRTRIAVERKAEKIGITFDRRAEFGPEFEVFMREKNAAGWSDKDIADEWGANICAVHRWRKRLGLPRNRYNARHCAKIRITTKLQCRDAGVRNLAALRAISRSMMAVRSGWPGGTTKAEGEVLDALEGGPCTLSQLYERLGRKWRGVQALVNRGHIRRTKRSRKYLYELAIVRKQRAA